VFVVRSDKAEFVPVKDRHRRRQVLRSARRRQGADRVITGPFNSVRDLADGTTVKIEEPRKK